MSTFDTGYQGDVTLRLRLPGESLSAREARRAVASWALTRGIGPDLDDLELVTSELVANAAAHGTGVVTLEAVDSGDVVRIRVTDHGTAGLVPRQPTPDDDSGRGLLIVSALSRTWGSAVGDGVTEVWAELLVARL